MPPGPKQLTDHSLSLPELLLAIQEDSKTVLTTHAYSWIYSCLLNHLKHGWWNKNGFLKSSQKIRQLKSILWVNIADLGNHVFLIIAGFCLPLKCYKWPGEKCQNQYYINYQKSASKLFFNLNKKYVQKFQY